MKKYFILFLVFVLALAIVGVARGGSAWGASVASNQSPSVAQTGNTATEYGSVSDQSAVIRVGPVAANHFGTVVPGADIQPITQSGSYSVGGICTLNVTYKDTNLSDLLAVDRNQSTSVRVKFPADSGSLSLPGCELTHYKTHKTTKEVNKNSDQGTWQICFATVPNKVATIYFYATPANKNSVWTSLETTVVNGQACALANTTGVYAPAYK